MPTSNPLNASLACTLVPDCVGSKVNRWAPSNRPGRTRRPSQATSRFSTTDVTVGLKDVGLLPGGWIVTLIFCPGTREPEMEVMKGSQEECPGRSARIAQTRPGLALISTVERAYAGLSPISISHPPLACMTNRDTLKSCHRRSACDWTQRHCGHLPSLSQQV